MATDKENVKSSKTRIPLPKDPLPPLPKYLVECKNGKAKYAIERYPLKTLNTHENLALPGPSHRAKPTVSETFRRLNDCHVTRRNVEASLDWELKVFKDDTCENDNVIDINDDEDTIKNVEYKFFVPNKQRNCLGESKVEETPVSKCLESKRVKKLKRSLKRPHSRELQGLSPVVKQQRNRNIDEKARQKLQYNEPIAEKLKSPDFLQKSYMECHSRDYVSDTFSYLTQIEQRPVSPNISSLSRACVINWLLKVHGADGNPATIQTAIWYLDSVLATGYVQVHKFQLLAAACYWVANKLHGPGFSAGRLVKFSNQAFTAQQLLCAEMEVLKRLKFPPQPVIPQEFITYLSWWCEQSHPGEIEVAATFLCLCGLMVDKSMCNECPSVVGTAAVRNALLLLRKKGLLTQLQRCEIFKAAEKKALNLSYICSMQRRAVRAVASPGYEYKAPLDHYGTPPSYIALRIVSAASTLSYGT